MKLMYYVSKCLGLVGFEWNEISPSCRRKIISVKGIVLHLFLTAVLTSMELFHFENEVFFISEIVTLISKVISHVILVILCFYNQRNICSIMKNVMQWSELLVNEYFYFRITVIIMHLCLGATIIIVYNIIDWFRMERYLDFSPRYILYIFTDLSLHVTELQFVNCVVFLNQCFTDINLRMETIQFTRTCNKEISTVYTTVLLRKLEFFCSFHDSLCDMAHLVNSVYSPVVLLDVGLSFIRSTQKLYHIVLSNLIQEIGVQHFHSVTYKCFQWIKFTFLIYACSSCSQKVSGTHLLYLLPLPWLSIKVENWTLKVFVGEAFTLYQQLQNSFSSGP
jgi:hypothetical protein